MREKLIEVAIVLSGITAALSPIALSLYVADHEGRRTEQALARSYAEDALGRSEKVTEQMAIAFQALTALEEKEGPCGPLGLAEMRRIDLGSSYIQAVGKVVGTQMLCSSLGLSGADMELGPIDAVQPTGVTLRTDVRLPFAAEKSFLVVEQFGYAAIIHKALPIDTALGVQGVTLATFSKANGMILTNRGTVDPAWIERFLSTGSENFTTGKNTVSVIASNRYVLGSLAALPASTMMHRLSGRMSILLPLGMAAGLLIGGLFIHLSYRQRALPAVLRRALKRDEFFLMYQPVVDLSSGRWVGAEALIRWRRRAGETVRPDTFIPVAEEYGLIGKVTNRVIDLIGHDARGVFSHRPDFHIALNISTSDLYNPATVNWLEALMASTGAGAGNLMVEITERSLTDGQRAAVNLDRLRQKGIKVAIDDFGTGYSNLGLLQKLELDYLKIDKSFVDTIGTHSASSGVIYHVVSMAKSLGIECIAEGVETEQQAMTLQQIGVVYAQGWLYAKPLTFDDLMVGLARQEAELRRKVAGVTGPGAPIPS